MNLYAVVVEEVVPMAVAVAMPDDEGSAEKKEIQTTRQRELLPLVIHRRSIYTKEIVGLMNIRFLNMSIHRHIALACLGNM